MEKRELTCICCPLGCQLTVQIDENIVQNISGYTCNRGRIYAEKEVTNPTRIVTSTVRVIGGEKPQVSVKTKEDIPKSKIFDVVRALKYIEIEAPVKIGDIIEEDIAGTGVAIVVTSNNCDCNIR
ncbi:MAG: DUF1667 domain-containing protein [Eubacteriales bacterium]|nr:DUF1667 domain-containing protein [Eubacteriales bacterium]